MDGIIYYNIGKKCLIRLAVSVCSLRRHYKGPVTILACKDSFNDCKLIAGHFNTDVKLCEFEDGDKEKNWVLLNKCRLHEKTPYERTIFIDSDTIVLEDFSKFIFRKLNSCEFLVTRFENWRTSDKHCKRRLNRWKGVIKDSLLEGTFKNPFFINTGFYAWTKGAKIFNFWHDYAKLNRYSFIPDEVACQILLPNFEHYVLSSDFNSSCKYSKTLKNAYTVHYHGRKHCRMDEKGEYIYNSSLWYQIFDRIKDLDVIKDNTQYDRMLTKSLRRRP